jgi:hypothetical protein
VDQLAALSREIGRQSTMIGYLDAFFLFAVCATAVIPLIGLARWKPN